jgi:hypothetical protein
MQFHFAKSLVTSSIMTMSGWVFGAGNPWIAPDNIMSTFEQFDTLPVYSSASTGSLGTVYLLKSDAKATNVIWDPSTVHDKLQNILYMSGKTLGKRILSGTNYQRLDETGAAYRNQCAAFAKAMTGAGSTTAWYRKTSNDLSALFPNGKASSQLAGLGKIRPGTMLATFGGAATYNSSPIPHVVIVKYLDIDNTGKVLGMMVYDQNGMTRVSLNGTSIAVGDGTNGTTNPTGGTIIKHYIPWNNTATTSAPLSMKNYTVVTD